MVASILQLIEPAERTIFDLEDVVRATLALARECDLTSASPNQFLTKLVASVVVERLRKGSAQ
jgi:hypothetical protein